jgi:hypothetical protein
MTKKPSAWQRQQMADALACLRQSARFEDSFISAQEVPELSNPYD